MQQPGDTPGSEGARASGLYPQEVEHSSQEAHLALHQAPSCLLANLEQTIYIPQAWVSLLHEHDGHEDDGGDGEDTYFVKLRGDHRS